MRFSRLSGKETGLFRMTHCENEIAISFNQRTVGLIAMIFLDRYFYLHLLQRKRHKSLSKKKHKGILSLK